MVKPSKAKTAGRIIKKIFISILVVLLIALVITGAYFFYLYTLATDTSEAYKLETTASTDIYEPLASSVITGYRQAITNDQLNGIIKKVMDEYITTEEFANSDIAIKNIAIYTRQNNRATVYADISFYDIQLIYSADIYFYLYEYEPSILIDVYNSKVGKLKIPDTIVLKALTESLEGAYDGIKINRNLSVQIPNVYTFELMNKEVELEIEFLQTDEDGNVIVQTTGMMNVISEIIDEMIEDAFSKEE